MKLLVSKKRKSVIIISLLLSVCFFMMPSIAHAEWTKEVTDFIFGNIAALISAIVGTAISAIVALVINLAQYNNFVNNDQVREAWIVIRDICNMMFVLILLVISFASILRIETYNIKKTLPKLVIMAVLINFSRMIVGLMIDFSQVFMLTFVSSFTSVQGNFHDALRIGKMISFAKDSTAISAGNVAALYGLAVIFLIIALIVMVSVMIIFLMRIIMLWILTALSPLAFLLSAFPAGEKYASQYWGMLSKYLINGPVLAFFIWMALNVSSNLTATFAKVDSKGGLEILQSDILASFAMTIGMLVGGMMISQQIGGMGAGMGMNMLNRAKGAAQGFATKQAMRVRDKAWSTTKSTARTGLGLVSTVDKFAGSLAGKRGTWAGKGLVGGTLAGAMAIPGGVKDVVSGKLGKYLSMDGDMDKQRHRSYLRAERIKQENPNLTSDALKDKIEEEDFIEKDGKKYHRSGDNYVEVDKDGNYVKKADGNNNYLTDKNGKEVKKMGRAGAAYYDSMSKVHSGARAAETAAEKEKINKEKERIAISGISDEQMIQELEDKTTSAARKMAIAMTLAATEGFKNKDQIEKARAAVSGNSEVSKEFNKEVYSKQAHIAHDLGSEEGRIQFKKAIDQGKIDSSKLKAAAYADGNVMRTLEEHHGDDFKKIIASATSRGSEYETKVATGLLAHRKSIKGNDDESKERRYKIGKIHANTAGLSMDSFRGDNNKVDIEQFGRYMSEAKPKDLSGASIKSLDAMLNDDNQGEDIMRAVGENMKYSTLRTMNRLGENRKITEKLTQVVHTMNTTGESQKIDRDDELNSYVSRS